MLKRLPKIEGKEYWQFRGKLVHVLYLPIAAEAQCHSVTARGVWNRERKQWWRGGDLKGWVKREKREDYGDTWHDDRGAAPGEKERSKQEPGSWGLVVGVDTNRMKCNGVCIRKCHADKGKKGVNVIKMHWMKSLRIKNYLQKCYS